MVSAILRDLSLIRYFLHVIMCEKLLAALYFGFGKTFTFRHAAFVTMYGPMSCLLLWRLKVERAL